MNKPFPPLIWCGLVLSALSGCTSGNTERDDPSRVRPPTEPVSVYQAPPEQPEVEAENERLARANQPVLSPVVDVPDDLACEGSGGSRVLTRLNRQEYNNTIHDLLGIDSMPGSAFPEDDFGDSFNNNGRSLTVSPVLTDAYLSNAEELSQRAVENILKCDPTRLGAENCAHDTFVNFLSRAFRRPVTNDEVEPFVNLVLQARDAGGTFEEGVAAGIEAALLSVNFLFKVELDPTPDGTEVHRLTDHELATRLSYFIWSSMPDEELTNLANQGALNSVETLEAQVDRMLEDPRSSTLLESFASQWLETGDISRSNVPDPGLFPEYTPSLQMAMQEETRLFMSDVLTGTLSYNNILNAGYSYLNAELATHYGIEGDFSSDFERATLTDETRAGLLTQGSVLTLTSAPNRTSVTRRGVWVLSNLLCAAPPPPPPGVQSDLDAPADEEGPGLTQAERARQHSSDPSCAGCHDFIDPIGFALDDFDAIGRHKGADELAPPPSDSDAGAPDDSTVDDGGTPPTEDDSADATAARVGSSDYNSAGELATTLSQDPRLPNCAARKLMTFALTQVPSSNAADRCRLTKLQDYFATQDYNMRTLIKAVTLTDSFRGRHGGLTTIETDAQTTEAQ